MYFRVMWGEICRKVQCTVAEVVRAAHCVPYCWKAVSRDVLFLQDPLGSCKGNDSVIQSWSSFLELFDNPHQRQRIPVINSGQQASLLGMFTGRCHRATTERNTGIETKRKKNKNTALSWFSYYIKEGLQGWKSQQLRSCLNRRQKHRSGF